MSVSASLNRFTNLAGPKLEIGDLSEASISHVVRVGPHPKIGAQSWEATAYYKPKTSDTKHASVVCVC